MVCSGQSFPQFSLGDFSPCCDALEDHLLLVLRCYFDGGNKPDSKQYKRLSLAVTCGTANQWKSFEREWKKNLVKHEACFLHTTDAVGRNGIYEGWTITQRDKFLGDCTRIAGKHMSRPAKGGSPQRINLFAITVTIVLADFIRAREEHLCSAQHASEICATQAIAACFRWGSCCEDVKVPIVLRSGGRFSRPHL